MHGYRDGLVSQIYFFLPLQVRKLTSLALLAPASTFLLQPVSLILLLPLCCRNRSSTLSLTLCDSPLAPHPPPHIRPLFSWFRSVDLKLDIAQRDPRPFAHRNFKIFSGCCVHSILWTLFYLVQTTNMRSPQSWIISLTIRLYPL